MIFREAVTADIPQIQVVRNLVKENPLPDPSVVSDADCEDYINRRGKGWVCVANGTVVGFAIVSVIDTNVWALFVQPGYERRDIGKILHDMMMNWYFNQTDQTIWLGTAPGTRAEGFYRKAGWKQTDTRPNGELKFEMTKIAWQQLQ